MVNVFVSPTITRLIINVLVLPANLDSSGPQQHKDVLLFARTTNITMEGSVCARMPMSCILEIVLQNVK